MKTYVNSKLPLRTYAIYNIKSCIKKFHICNNYFFKGKHKSVIKSKEALLMSKTVVGIFEDFNSAELAARRIKEQGLRTDDISIIAKHDMQFEGEHHGAENRVNDNISDGVITGGLLGTLGGLLLGVGTIAIPGLGIIAAAGPITGLISGAVAGGLIGGLVDLGIPEEHGKRYEMDIKGGAVMFAMRTDDDKVDKVANILRNNGARTVDVH